MIMDMQSVADILRSHGFKVTPQRLAVYDALQNTTEHPNAEMLYNMLLPRYPAMSLATVYKTMEIFDQIGLAQVLNIGEDSYRYDARMENHPDVRCNTCGRVDDIMEFEDEAIMSQVAKLSDYKLTGRQLYFYGECPKCQEKKKKYN